MKNNLTMSCCLMLVVIFFSLCLSIKATNVYEIKESISGNKNYTKVSFESDEKNLNHYFKYKVNNIPQSRIGAFRIKFEAFNQLSLEKNQVYCTFVDESATDDDLVKAFEKVNDQNTNCIGQFNIKGIFEGLLNMIKLKKNWA